MLDPSLLEKEVLRILLAGEHRVLKALRAQLPHIAVVSREQTGAGLYTTLVLEGDALRLPDVPDLVVGDLYARLPQRALPYGFLLYVRSGAMFLLEGFSHDSEWPDSLEWDAASFFYSDPVRTALLAQLDDGLKSVSR